MPARVRPYTVAGLSRVPCAHCGASSTDQWSLRPCAIGTASWYGLCRDCDIALNRIVVEFLRVPDGETLLARYGAER